MQDKNRRAAVLSGIFIFCLTVLFGALPIVGWLLMVFKVILCGMSGQTLPLLLKRLKSLRKRFGLTQEQFAEASGISYKYYQQIEAGRKPDLRLSTLERLAEVYGLEVWQLLLPEGRFLELKSVSVRSRA